MELAAQLLEMSPNGIEYSKALTELRLAKLRHVMVQALEASGQIIHAHVAVKLARDAADDEKISRRLGLKIKGPTLQQILDVALEMRMID
jgi:hypothetical protein